MTYVKAFDITDMPQYMRRHIHPGQWVYLLGGKSRYMGQRRGIDYCLHGKRAHDPSLVALYRSLATNKGR